MKTFDKKDVYSWSNAEEAKQYIGACGYFADSLADLQECVSNNNIMRLFNICLEPKIDVDSVFSLAETDYQYALFLPVDKVKEVEEKKYRPFKSVDEFMNHLDFQSLMNNYIKVENKITSERYEFMIVGCFNNGLVLPLYGALIMDQLFEKFNICIDGTWQPFGVEA